MDFWEILNAKLDESGMDDQDFAVEVLHVNRSTFSRIKRGSDPSFPILVQIADSLGLEILAEPSESHTRKKVRCTDAELRDCLGRIGGLDNRDIEEVIDIVRIKATPRLKKGSATQGEGAA